MKLLEYLSKERGRQAALAKAIDAHASDISAWAHESRPIPVPFGAPIEIATNREVTRQEMFPDDWMKIWPELLNQSNEDHTRRSTDKDAP
jgi:DNA-binding transcriptional regulator YdaS (Cro superfamily)